MNEKYESLEVIEIGNAEDLILANGSSDTIDNVPLQTRFP